MVFKDLWVFGAITKSQMKSSVQPLEKAQMEERRNGLLDKTRVFASSESQTEGEKPLNTPQICQTPSRLDAENTHRLSLSVSLCVPLCVCLSLSLSLQVPLSETEDVVN